MLLRLPLDLRYGRDIAKGVARQTASRGWFLIVSDDPEPEFVRRIEAHRAEYLGAIGSFADTDVMKRLGRLLPTVNVSNRSDSELLPSVTSDDFEVGRMAARFLAEKGLLHFGFLGHGSYAFSRQRLEGYRSELLRRGRACADFDWAGAPRDDQLDHLARWLARQPHPLALFAANDRLARHAVLACRRVGLAIPEQVAILGADDDETESWLAGVPLSSIRLPFERIGQHAMQWLARMIEGRSAPASPLRLSPLGVVERHSTDMIAVDDPVVSEALRFAREVPAAEATVRAAAAHVGVSVRALQYRCKAQLDRPFHEVAMALRLARAHQLLLDSDLTISEIAHRCGMGSAKSFGRAFRERYGYRPTDLRRRTTSKG